ncbi:MAG: hypothetical protein JKY54_17170 [Flavobacteriales bacterium]|nr:hypothetical protein [Flavobacteriales bacterium]
MSLFEKAKKFFTSCESLEGWDACKGLVAENAKFDCQSEALIEVKTVNGYVDWVTGLGTVTAPGSSYKLHAAGFDEAKKTAIFFATYTATHTGEGGPVSPTGKTTNTDYVYSIQMNDDGKVVSMTKIWNAPWAFRELGWM